MTRTYFKKLTAGLTVLATAATMSGCSAGYSTDNNSTVLLIIAGINGGDVLKSDVLTNDGVFNDQVEVAIAVRFKNPNIPTVPQIPSAVVIDRYEVKYRRSDGRGVEGQDVPYTISGNTTAAFDVKTSGTDPLILEVVRLQAKLEPPLRNLVAVAADGGGGGGLIVTMFADITLHGHTISGQTVSAKGILQIDFANFGG